MNADLTGRLHVPGPSSRYILPQFEERTSYGMKRLDPYTKGSSRTASSSSGCRSTTRPLTTSSPRLIVLESGPGPRHPHVHQRSGGSFTAMTAIYDTMQYIRPDVQTFVIGQAASAAAVLLGAGAKGKRFAHRQQDSHPPARHRGHRWYGLRPGDPRQRDHRMRGWLEDTIAQHSGRDVGLVRKDIERDKILSAEAAKEHGLIDEVLTSRKNTA